MPFFHFEKRQGIIWVKLVTFYDFVPACISLDSYCPLKYVYHETLSGLYTLLDDSVYVCFCFIHYPYYHPHHIFPIALEDEITNHSTNANWFSQPQEVPAEFDYQFPS